MEISTAYGIVALVFWAAWLIGAHTYAIRKGMGTGDYTGLMFLIGVFVGLCACVVWPLTCFAAIYSFVAYPPWGE